MFFHQQRDFTITADEMQWVLVWHGGGPKYKVDKRTGEADRLQGKRSYFPSLSALLVFLLDKRCKCTSGFDDLREKLPGFRREILALARMESDG